MISQEFDNVKAEKAIAMRRYNRRRKFKWMFELCLVALLVSRSASWLPAVAKFLGDIFRQIIAVLNSPFYVFMLFNLMIFLVYALSRRERSDVSNAESNPINEEFAGKTDLDRIISVADESKEKETEDFDEITVQEKQIVCSSEKAISWAHEQTVCPDSENATPPSPVHEQKTVCPVETVSYPVTTEKEDLEMKRYRRTRSESYERRIVKKATRRELRRSDTETCMEIVRSEGDEKSRRSSSVEELNDVEFQRTIEAFIATQKWIHREEQKAEHKCPTLTC